MDAGLLRSSKPAAVEIDWTLRGKTNLETPGKNGPAIFALASAAVVMMIAGGNVTQARVALGGVGTKPWRSPEAEAALVGQAATQANFRKAAEAALRDAKPQGENGFKIEMAKRCLAHALHMAATG